MKIFTKEETFETKGAGDLIDITDELNQALLESSLEEGLVLVFVIGSTAAIITMEYEPGLIKDLRELYQKLVPEQKAYAHDLTWNDANGFSHLRSTLQGTSLVIPFKRKKLLLGTWQQVVLAEFDNRSRNRKVIFQFLGN